MKKIAVLLSIFVISFISSCASNQNPKVAMHTTKGKMVIELYPKEAPITVENFLKYVDDGFYDGVIFHRIVPGFVIQGGGYDKDYKQKTTFDPIKNESDNGLKNEAATLSMARTPVVDSATSQFFINLKYNAALDFNEPRKQHGYAVFGKVIEGFEVAQEIEKAPRGNLRPPFVEAPREQIVIEKVVRL